MTFARGTEGGLGSVSQELNEAAIKTWQFARNYRDLSGNEPTMPLAERDVKLDSVRFLSRDPADPNFMRPPSESPLATGGAGSDLPTYVGAVAPEGAELWDWPKLWAARYPKMVLIVSKDPKDAGEFRSINEALAKVTRPGMTIRVLDNGEYTETIQIRKPAEHDGLTLEAPRAATLVVPPQSRLGILIANVPRVTIRGFAVQVNESATTGVGVTGFSPGVVLEALRFRATQTRTTGATTDSLIGNSDSPVIIQHCSFANISNGLEIIGMNLSNRSARPIRSLVVRENDFVDNVVGIWCKGRVNEVQITGNRFSGFSEAGMRADDLLEGSGQILISNNSLKGPRHCFEFVGAMKGMTDFAIRNNVLIAESGPDFVYTGDDRETVAQWSIDHNWRQVRPPPADDPESKVWIEASSDTLAPKIDLLSFDPTSKDFMRPAKDSPLAHGGSGGELPDFAGAVPPAGSETWDWNATWHARQRASNP